MSRNKRRHSTGFGYIGFGNNQNLFNRHSKKPFSLLKEKLDYEAHFHFKIDFKDKKLSKSEKETIKNKIRKDEKIRNQKTTIIFIFVMAIILFLLALMIKQVMSNL